MNDCSNCYWDYEFSVKRSPINHAAEYEKANSPCGRCDTDNSSWRPRSQEPQTSPWIPVSPETLSEEGTQVLLTDGEIVRVGSLVLDPERAKWGAQPWTWLIEEHEEGFWDFEDLGGGQVTHWMKLPELPKKESNES